MKRLSLLPINRCMVRQMNSLRKLLGDAGELAIMSALRRDGHNPRHVSLISDRFGYDIELKEGVQTLGLEIKAAVKATAARAFISRNEFEVAKRMGERWKLVQVTFSSRVIASGRATAGDVESIRELSSHSLVDMAPVEKEGFRWTEAAEIRPSETEWKPKTFELERSLRPFYYPVTEYSFGCTAQGSRGLYLGIAHNVGAFASHKPECFVFRLLPG